MKRVIIEKKVVRKSLLSRFWNYLWHDDSWGSVLVFLVVASVFIRFIMYPVLGLFLGSSQPIVAVISSSMVHPVGFDEWWNVTTCKDKFSGDYKFQREFYDSLNISREDFEGFRFKNGFNRGDVMILSSAKDVKIGDVVVANNGGVTAYPVIHRVVKVGATTITTAGDNNKCEIWSFENSIPKSMIIGKAVVWIPYLGWIKVGAVWFWNVISGGVA